VKIASRVLSKSRYPRPRLGPYGRARSLRVTAQSVQAVHSGREDAPTRPGRRTS